jgi:hypothetical protein
MRRPKRTTPQAPTPSADHSEWRLLSEVYHHVLKRSPSPETAKIAIKDKYQNGKLRLRCTLREHKARPGLQLTEGESPPPVEPVVTPDYEISPAERFDSDWERSCATHRDPISKSLFQYDGITGNWHEVLIHWPPEPSVRDSTGRQSQNPGKPKRKRAKRTDVNLIRSLAREKGWSDAQFFKMSTGLVQKLLGDELKTREGDLYHERHRSTYRRAQRRLPTK